MTQGSPNQPQHSMGDLVFDYEHPDTAHAAPGRRWGVITGGGVFPEMVGPMFITYDDLAPGEPARFGVRILPRHCNGVHVAHGGLLSTFLDTAFAQSLLSAIEVDWNVPTINLVTDFLSAAVEGEWLESRVQLTHATGRMAFLSGTVLAGERLVLRGQAIFKITRKARA